jgi:hypothetical protein
VPVTLDVKPYESLIHGHQLAGVFKYDRSLKVVGYILIHPNGKIDSMTASCCSILRVDWKKVSMKLIDIDSLFPHFMSNRSDYES